MGTQLPISNATSCHVVVLISANVEWQVVHGLFPDVTCQTSPFGQWFQAHLTVNNHLEPTVFFHGGWGKISAAASTQYVIDHWSPMLLVNLGTCGGIEGEVEIGTILLVERTLVYDILELMSDSIAAITHYTTELDLSWLRDPLPVSARRSLLVSADRDLVVEDIPYLKAKFAAIAGDWESGAIAYVAARNRVRCLILRGVSDLVGNKGGEAYGNFNLFTERTKIIMHGLLDALPAWIAEAMEGIE